MDSHTYSARKLQHLEVVEVGRRRRFSNDEKQRIVLESLQWLRPVSATARRHDISHSLFLIGRRTFEVSQSTTWPAPAIRRS